MHAIIVMENLYRLKELKDFKIIFIFSFFYSYPFSLSLSLSIPLSVFSSSPTKRIQFDLLKPDRSLIQLPYACKPTSIQYLPCLGLRNVSEIQNKWFRHFIFSWSPTLSSFGKRRKRRNKCWKLSRGSPKVLSSFHKNITGRRVSLLWSQGLIVPVSLAPQFSGIYLPSCSSTWTFKSCSYCEVRLSAFLDVDTSASSQASVFV